MKRIRGNRLYTSLYGYACVYVRKIGEYVSIDVKGKMCTQYSLGSFDSVAGHSVVS